MTGVFENGVSLYVVCFFGRYHYHIDYKRSRNHLYYYNTTIRIVKASHWLFYPYGLYSDRSGLGVLWLVGERKRVKIDTV